MLKWNGQNRSKEQVQRWTFVLVVWKLWVQLVRFEDFTATKFEVVVFWFVTSCRDMVGYQRLGGQRRLHLQGEDEEGGSKVVRNTCAYHIITRHHNPRDHDLNLASKFLHFNNIFRVEETYYSFGKISEIHNLLLLLLLLLSHYSLCLFQARIFFFTYGSF
jgi:hypothetical protein